MENKDNKNICQYNLSEDDSRGKSRNVVFILYTWHNG